VNFLRRLVLQGKKSWWQLAFPCCWNRARPWHASELVSFLVGLRTYQHLGNSTIQSFLRSEQFLFWPRNSSPPRFSAAVIKTRLLCPSWARSIHSTATHPIYWFASILSAHLGVFLPSGLFSSKVYPPKPCVQLFSPPHVPHAPPIPLFVIWSPEKNSLIMTHPDVL